jgi:hypothetical protein
MDAEIVADWRMIYIVTTVFSGNTPLCKLLLWVDQRQF